MAVPLRRGKTRKLCSCLRRQLFYSRLKNPTYEFYVKPPLRRPLTAGQGRAGRGPPHHLPYPTAAAAVPHGPRVAPFPPSQGAGRPPRAPRLCREAIPEAAALTDRSTARPESRARPSPSPPAEGYTAARRAAPARRWRRPPPGRFSPRAAPPPCPLGSIQRPGPAAPRPELRSGQCRAPALPQRGPGRAAAAAVATGDAASFATGRGRG